MAPPLTFKGRPLPPEESAILERMIQIQPLLQNGDRDLTEHEALNLLDFVPNGELNYCDLFEFNRNLAFADYISPDDYQKVYRFFANHSSKLKKLKLGSFYHLQKCPAFNPSPKSVSHRGVEILLSGHSTQIDEGILKGIAETVAVMNPYLVNPSRKFSIFWSPGMNLPGGTRQQPVEIFSGSLHFGPKATKIAVTYRLAVQMAKEIEEQSINFKLNRSPGDKGLAELWGRFCPLHLKAEKRWDLFEFFDPSRYQSEIPKDWGFDYHKKHQILVPVDHFFAEVAVTARYFRKEFEERLKTVPNDETRNLAREIMGLVAPKFGISP